MRARCAGRETRKGGEGEGKGGGWEKEEEEEQKERRLGRKRKLKNKTKQKLIKQNPCIPTGFLWKGEAGGELQP